MELDTHNETPENYEGNYEEEEGEVDFELVLVSSLRYLRRTKRR